LDEFDHDTLTSASWWNFPVSLRQCAALMGASTVVRVRTLIDWRTGQLEHLVNFKEGLFIVSIVDHGIGQRDEPG
jgi:hypothetical protein